LGAAALIVAADLLARGWSAVGAGDVSSGPQADEDDGEAAKASPTTPTGSPMLVTIYTDGRPSPGWALFSVAGDEAVVVKPGEALRRVPITDVGGQ
jgi:hypothetical protein